jgi:hypothetical protein
MEQSPAEKLLEVLKNGADQDRAFTTADLLFQFESYVLNGSMNVLGLMAKHPDAARDLFATKVMLDELATWAKSLYGPLYLYSGVSIPADDPLKRAQNAEGAVVH